MKNTYETYLPIFVLGYEIKFDPIVGKYTIKSQKGFGWGHYDEVQDAINTVEKHFFNEVVPKMTAYRGD